jgi:hypothetical protein
MNNHIYNLFSQLVHDRRSIYRIQKFYLKDARNCKKCQDFWKKLIKQKEEESKLILKIIESH